MLFNRTKSAEGNKVEQSEKVRKGKQTEEESHFAVKETIYHLGIKLLEGAAIGLGGIFVASIAKSLGSSSEVAGDNVVSMTNRKVANS